MERIDASVLDYWEAYYRVEPFGQDWNQTARICSQLETLITLQAKDWKPRAEVDFIPYGRLNIKSKKRKRGPVVSPSLAASIASISSTPAAEEAKRLMQRTTWTYDSNL